MSVVTITRIEWGTLEGARPRVAGANARLDVHGRTVRVLLVRLTDSDGATGWGWSRARAAHAETLVGAALDTLFDPARGVPEPGLSVEWALWDLMGQRAGLPVYALAAQINGKPCPPTVRARCYDTSLYMDDLHLSDTDAAAAFIAHEARQGWETGHRAFKIKVGRGAWHMDWQAGTARDIAVVKAVRDAVGPTCPLMLDANNGYTLNIAKHVLEQTAACHVHWMEEAFHEDAEFYRQLKQWLADAGLGVLIADGEGDASPHLLRWAKDGLIDVVQYDIFGEGLTRWLSLGRTLDGWNVGSAPHHYGGHYGNYAACHLSPAIDKFTFAEWDDVLTPGLDASGYIIKGGFVHVPDAPGFGLHLDDAVFARAVCENGGTAQK